MSYFIIIRGPLGIGKSTITKSLAKTIDADYISVDKILEENGLDREDDNFIPEDFIKANKIILSDAKDSLKKGRIIIFDGCFYFKEQITHLEKSLPFKCLIFNLKAPVEVCIKRDSERKKVYGEKAVKEVYELVSKFDYGINVYTEDKSKGEVIKEIISYLPSKTLKPKKLQKGDTIAVLSPSLGGPSVFPHIYDNGLKILKEKFGLKIKEYPTARMDVRIKGCKTLEDVKKFMELNKVKIIFFAETHGLLDELIVQDKIISQLKPTCYLYELLEEEKLISKIDFIKFLERNDSERFSIISSFEELKPTVLIAKKYNLPLIGCDVKNMYRKNKDFLKKIDKTEEEKIILNREKKQIEVIKKSLIQYGIPIFVSLGAFHLRKDSQLFKEIKLNHIIVYPLIDDMKLGGLEENFNIKDVKKITYIIESNKNAN